MPAFIVPNTGICITLCWISIYSALSNVKSFPTKSAIETLKKLATSKALSTVAPISSFSHLDNVDWLTFIFLESSLFEIPLFSLKYFKFFAKKLILYSPFFYNFTINFAKTQYLCWHLRKRIVKWVV